MRRVLLVFVATLISCTNKPAEGTLKVVIDASDSALTSRCTRLFARGSSELISDPLDLTGKDQVVVAIYAGMELGDLELEAVGYSDTACTVETVPAERTGKSRHGFGMPSEVTLTLKRAPVPDGGIDADGDGSFLPDDCNDANPAIRPGATELCGDGVDNDCDQARDCADDGCDGLTCANGATCVAAACAETTCDDGLDNNGVGGIDCFDPGCDLRPCLNGGTCREGGCRAASEAGLCGDGIDNDGDDAVDCSDLIDCPMGAACDDKDPCTSSGTCDGAGHCTTTQLTCDMPPTCFQTNGACEPDAGCPYAPAPGALCDDGRRCTTQDFCRDDGGCGGAEVMCTTPPNTCFSSVGTCSESLDGGCVYAPLNVSSTCDDQDPCTGNDACDGDGGCRGVGPLPSECPARECFVRDAGACTPSDLCGFTAVPNGTPCSIGTCSGGQCVSTPVFTFPPSNFTEADLPASLGKVTINCEFVTLNTGLADGGFTWTDCDGTVRVPAHRVVANGNTPALLLYMDSLTIGAAGHLRARGPRPLIVAVKNDALIDGAIDVDGFIGTTLSRGAGANHADCAAGFGKHGGLAGSPLTAGGGGGGSFGSVGGRGHFGEGGGSSLGGDAGATFGNSTLVPLLGGCNGGNGGAASETNQGLGGRGGGALQLTVGGILRIEGDVSANGGGGQGGRSDLRTGGGGGGSGGAILLEAQRLVSTLYGNVTANGGGGGEGSGYSAGVAYHGDRGNNGAVSLDGAAGGASAACGGNGGQGAARNDAVAGNGAGPHCGTNMPGGGGGGGMGRIHVRGVDGGCQFDAQSWFSPPRTGVGTGCQ